MENTERYFKLDDAPDNYEGEEAMAYVNGANFGYEVGKLEIIELAKRMKKANAENDQKEWLSLHDEIYKLADA